MKESSVTISQEEYDYYIKAIFAVEIILNLKESYYDLEDAIRVILDTLKGQEVRNEAKESDNPSDDCEPSA